MSTITLNREESDVANAIWTLLSKADYKIQLNILNKLVGLTTNVSKAKVKTTSSNNIVNYTMKTEKELTPDLQKLVGIIPANK